MLFLDVVVIVVCCCFDVDRVSAMMMMIKMTMAVMILILNCLDENRVAENTAGSYEVLLPDGRVQTVVYKVNGEEGGYLAEVSYNGEPVYPVEPVAAPVPASRPVAYRRLPTVNYQPTAAPVKEEPVEAETDAPVAVEASPCN